MGAGGTALARRGNDLPPGTGRPAQSHSVIQLSSGTARLTRCDRNTARHSCADRSGAERDRAADIAAAGGRGSMGGADRDLWRVHRPGSWELHGEFGGGTAVRLADADAVS